MARRFNGSTDYINAGSAASLDDIGGNPPTGRAFACWTFTRGLGGVDGGRLFQKHNVASSSWNSLFYSVDGPRINIGGGTTVGEAWTNGSPRLPEMAWLFFGGSYLSGAGGPRLYAGSLTSVVREQPTYSVRQDVAGYNSDAAGNFVIGNGAVGDTRAMLGDLAMLAVFDNLLTRDQFEIIRQSAQTRGQLFPLDLLKFFVTAGGTQINVKGLWLFDT